MNILDIKNVHFRYTPEEEILKGLTLSLDAKPTAIIGQNGAGKTTFVKLLKGLLRPTSGKIIFDEKDISTVSVAAIAKDIGMIFQNPNDQIFKNTVLEEVMFGPLQLKMNKKHAKIVSEKALIMVGLMGVADVNPYDLNLSDRKLISIASIIAMNPKVVIFDEPTIAQDHLGKRLIENIIKTLSAQGKLVISILHDMDFVAQCFERVIVFSKGEIILDGPTREVFEQKEILESVYLEQPHIVKLGNAVKVGKVLLNVEEFADEIRSNINYK